LRNLHVPPCGHAHLKVHDARTLTLNAWLARDEDIVTGLKRPLHALIVHQKEAVYFIP
jgi:hypothetical protein